MLKYIFLIFISCHAFSQVQSLPEYNRSLLGQLISEKPLSPKEFKSLRIRLGAELTSADDRNYKENELLKLLEYATYSAYLSKSKADENMILDMWKQYLALPNTTKKSFEVSYVSSLLPNEEKNPASLIKTYEFFLKFAPKDNSKVFFLPLVASNCSTLSAMKKTAELEKCWNLENEISNDHQAALRKTTRDRVIYYSSAFNMKKEFQSLANKILADEKMKRLHPVTKFLIIENKIKDGELKDVDKDIEKLRISSRDGRPWDNLLLKYYLAQNNLDKATATFKTLSQNNLTPVEESLYNQLATEYYFRLREYQKADYYLNRLLENEKRPLVALASNVVRASILLITASKSPMTAIKTNIKDSKKIMTENAIDSPEYLTLVKVAEVLTDNPKVNMAELKAAVTELKKFNYPNIGRVVVLDQLITILSER